MKYRRLIYHILFWLAFLFLYPIWFLNVYSKFYINNLFSNLFVLPGFIIGLYFIIYYLVPNLLLKKRKYIPFVLIYFSTVIALTFHDILINRYVFLPIIEPQFIEKYEKYAFKARSIFRVFVMIQSQIFIFISLKYLKNYIEEYLEKEKLKTKIAETELNMLKSQIHPHFLFNTLNNIYTLSIEGRNEQVSESIEKLSEILRYTIYECKNKLIPLEKELTIIDNYIKLEKLRYSQLDIEIILPDNTDFIFVLPLLFFIFVENAFKHGNSKSIKNKWLKIKLEIEKNNVIFSVKNSKSPNIQKDPLNYSQGIGLENAKKRLDYYFGKGNYILKIKDLKDSFEIYLRHKILNNEN